MGTNRKKIKEKIQIELCEQEIRGMIQQHHFKEEDFLMAEGLNQKMKECLEPVCYFAKTGGKGVFLYSLGRGIDDLAEELDKSEAYYERFMLDCMSQEILKKAYQEGERLFYRAYGLWPETYHFLGNKGTITEYEAIKKVIHFFEPEEIKITDAFMMIPTKTTVFYTEISEKRENNILTMCDSCGRCKIADQTVNTRCIL